MGFHNKLECLSLASFSSLMFPGKAGAYPSEAPFRWTPVLTHKHNGMTFAGLDGQTRFYGV
jgi:hypothetical protein